MPFYSLAQEAVPTNILQNWNYIATIASFFFVLISAVVGLIWRSAVLSSIVKDGQQNISELKSENTRLSGEITTLKSEIVLLKSDVKQTNQIAVESKAERVRQEGLITAQSVRVTLLESNYTRVVVDLHDLKELVQKIYDKITGWDAKSN